MGFRIENMKNMVREIARMTSSEHIIQFKKKGLYNHTHIHLHTHQKTEIESWLFLVRRRREELLRNKGIIIPRLLRRER